MKYRCSLVLHALIVGLVMNVSQRAHAYTINTTEVGKRIRWSVDTVPLQIDSSFEEFLGPGEAYAALAMAFDAWRGLPRVPDMTIRPGTPEALGHHDGHMTNGVFVLRDWPYESAKLAVTIVTYEMDTGRLLDADVVVNGQAHYALLTEPVKRQKVASYDLAAVLTHEAGHILGLGESNDDQDATMWPYAKPDDVDKRTLAQDDEDGAIESYFGAPPPAANGCGNNSIGGRLSGRSALTMSLWLLAIIPMVRRTRRRRQLLLIPAAGLAFVLLSGFELPGVASDNAQQRMLDIDRLLREGTRDDQAQIEQLVRDDDPELARRAYTARLHTLTRAGMERSDARSALSQERLGRLLGRGTRLLIGRAKLTGTVERAGLLFTEYEVATSEGRKALRVPGGVRDGIGQRVIDAEPPPVDDQELVLAPQPDGTQHWAYHQKGLIFGGDLGEGAAIQGAL